LREPQARSARKASDSRLGNPEHARICDPRGLQLFVEGGFLVVPAEEEIAIDALEPAIDVFLVADRFDPVNGCRVACVREAGAIGAVQAQDLLERVVDDIGEVGGRDRRLPVADSTGVENRHRAPFAREQVSGRQARDTCADDADVGPDVLSE